MRRGRGRISATAAAFEAVRPLDEERAALYNNVVLTSLRGAARAVFEDLMANGTYQYKSDFAKRYVAQGEAAGRAQGEASGRAQGEARGRALAVLAVLTARGVVVPAEVRARVLACTDVAVLDGWIARAANAKDAGEVVGE